MPTRSRNASFFLEEPEQIKVIMQAIFDEPELIKNKKAVIAELAKPDAARDLVQNLMGES